jgi:hypothetical protein
MLSSALSPSYTTYDLITSPPSPSSPPSSFSAPPFISPLASPASTYLANKHNYLLFSRPSLSSIPTKNHHQHGGREDVGREGGGGREVGVWSFLREYSEYHVRTCSILVPEFQIWVNAVVLHTDDSMYFRKEEMRTTGEA